MSGCSALCCASPMAFVDLNEFHSHDIIYSKFKLYTLELPNFRIPHGTITTSRTDFSRVPTIKNT